MFYNASKTRRDISSTGQPLNKLLLLGGVRVRVYVFVGVCTGYMIDEFNDKNDCLQLRGII